MTVIYKQASETDIENIAPLVEALGYDFNFDVVYRTFKSLQTRGDSLLIATSNGQIVGMVQALVDVRIAEGISGEIVSLCVLPDFRSKGIAKNLINNARAILVSKGCSTLRVRANDERKEVKDIYIKIGFEHIKKQNVFMKKIVQ